jgi:glycosyltransferase involved in cell wall biosynthesis
MPPLFSIIIAAYNRSDVLRCSIQSTLDQTITDFELLVMGDGCTDNSEQVTLSFGDPRVRWENLPENTGNQAGPNNRGLALATGHYVAYLSQDDLWHPDHLAILLETYRQTNAEFVYSYAAIKGDHSYMHRRLWGVSQSGEYEFGMWISASMYSHLRQIGTEIGGYRNYESISAPVIADFVLRVAERGTRFACSHQLTVFRIIATDQPDIYAKPDSSPQDDLLNRLRANPERLRYEMALECALSAIQHPRPITKFDPAKAPPPGYIIEKNRRARGLPPRMELPVWPPPPTLAERARLFMLRVLHKLIKIIASK